VAVLITLVLPESPISWWPAGRRRADCRTLARVAPELRIDAATRFTGVAERAERAPVRHLFAPGRRSGTLLLWVASFVAFACWWSSRPGRPAARPLGVPVARTAVALAMFNGGSVLATAAGGWLITRFGARRVLRWRSRWPPSASGHRRGRAFDRGVAGLLILIGVGLGCASSGVIGLAAVALPDRDPLDRDRLGARLRPGRVVRGPWRWPLWSRPRGGRRRVLRCSPPCAWSVAGAAALRPVRERPGRTRRPARRRSA